MEFLGWTLKDIAKQKAGIIKRGTTVITSPQEAEVIDVLFSETKENDGEFIQIDPTKILTNQTLNENSGLQTFSYKDFLDLKIPLLGKHQTINGAVAIETALILQKKGFVISNENIRDGLLNTFWPGRFERVINEPPFIIDGAHNLKGAIALNSTLEEYYKTYKKIIILGLLQDKEVEEIIDVLIKSENTVITVNPLNERFLPAEILSQRIKEKFKGGPQQPQVFTCPDFRDGVEWALKLYQERECKLSVICACGSLYYIGEVREYLKVRKKF
jgi:dihydrofolate synthase/folylpolyglutamate synthase